MQSALYTYNHSCSTSDARNTLPGQSRLYHADKASIGHVPALSFNSTDMYYKTLSPPPCVPYLAYLTLRAYRSYALIPTSVVP